MSITKIAMKCGFNSSTDFSRSFKSFYKISPKVYRLNGNNNIHGINKIKNAFVQKIDIEKKINLKKLEDHTLAYVRTSGLSKTHNSIKIKMAYEYLLKWASSKNLINKNTLFLGVIIDNPEVLSMEDCRFLASITVPDDAKGTGRVCVSKMSLKGEYITYIFDRTSETFNKHFFEVCNYLYGYYFPDNGFIPDDRPFIERFLEDKNQKPLLELYIPVKYNF
jgi:AraC family transcriptional regulator